jgi:hypothetical protein
MQTLPEHNLNSSPLMHITLVFPTIDLHHKVELAIQKRWNQKLPAPTTSAGGMGDGQEMV